MLIREDLLGGSGATAAVGVVGGVANDGDSGDDGEVGCGDKTGSGVLGTKGSGFISGTSGGRLGSEFASGTICTG